MVDSVQSGRAVDGIKIPTGKDANRAGCTIRKVGRACRDTRGGCVNVLSTDELTVRIKNIEHPGSIPWVKRGRRWIGPSRRLHSAIKEKRLDGAVVCRRVEVIPAIAPMRRLN